MPGVLPAERRGERGGRGRRPGRHAGALLHGEVEALVVGALAAAAAFVAGLAGCAPTGMERTDVVLTALLAAAATALGARATPLALGIAATVALVAGETVPLPRPRPGRPGPRRARGPGGGRGALPARRRGHPPARPPGRNRPRPGSRPCSPSRWCSGSRWPSRPGASAGIAAVALVAVAWSGWRRLGPVAGRAGRRVVGGVVALAAVGLVTGVAAGVLALTSAARRVDGVGRRPRRRAGRRAGPGRGHLPPGRRRPVRRPGR